MKKIMTMMVMMLTIVVSTSGKTNTNKVNDHKSHVNVEVNVCPPRPVVNHVHYGKCCYQGKIWRSGNCKQCKKCKKQMRKLYKKNVKHLHNNCSSHR
ncbi:MAG: hypothetical protein PUC25_06535 [Prevotellaceae bacterium]|nr:hypothetical protein [Prevotellaceae bacterium]